MTQYERGCVPDGLLRFSKYGIILKPVAIREDKDTYINLSKPMVLGRKQRLLCHCLKLKCLPLRGKCQEVSVTYSLQKNKGFQKPVFLNNNKNPCVEL